MTDRELSAEQKQFFVNPYPVYEMARNARAIWDEELGFWRVTRFSDIDSILKDHRFGKIAPPGTEHLGPPERLDRFERGILSLDPPDHTRIRSLMVKAFSAKRVEMMRPIIQALVDTLIDGVYDRGEMEIKTEFAHPIPATIISDMLGIPDADRSRFAELSNDIIRYGNDVLEADQSKADAAVGEFHSYLDTLIALKRKNPADDLTTALIQAQDEIGRLNDEELQHNVSLLFIAGHETTVNLICNAIVALHRHPEQLAALRQDSSLMPRAVEEFLRYDSSVQQLPRVVQEDLELDGQTLRAGQMVILMLGSANHDPDVYEEAQTLDVQRPFIRAKSFGGGAHFCLGAQLARIETEVALNTLLTRLPNLRIQNLDELAYPPNPFFRGPEALNANW